MRRAAALAVTIALLSACTNDENAAADAVGRFETALKARDFAAACNLLAPQTRKEIAAEAPCEKALEEARLPELGGEPITSVYGRSAQVRGDGDTLFLTEFAVGWRIVAAGCAGTIDNPYDCSLKG